MTPFLGRREAYNYTVDNWNIFCSFSSKSFQCSISMESNAGQLIGRTLVVSCQRWRRPLGSRHRHLVWHRAAVRVRESVSGHLSSTYLGHLLPTNLNSCHLFCKSWPLHFEPAGTVLLLWPVYGHWSASVSHNLIQEWSWSYVATAWPFTY